MIMCKNKSAICYSNSKSKSNLFVYWLLSALGRIICMNSYFLKNSTFSSAFEFYVSTRNTNANAFRKVILLFSFLK